MQHTHARKRLTRREIKEDKLLIWTSRASMFLEDHLWPIVGGVAAVVVVIVGVWLYRGWSERQTLRGMEQIAGLADLVRSGQHEQAIQRADEIMDTFGGEPDRIARFYKADALRALGKCDEAMPLYDDWAGDAGGDEVRSFHATKGIAECLGTAGKYGEAGKKLDEWAEENPKSGLAAHALVEAAANYELGNDFPAAIHALEHVIEDYDDAQVVGRARQRLKLLEGAQTLTQ